MDYDQYHTRWRTRYERFLVAASHGDGVVTDGHEYVRRFRGGGASIDSNPALRRSLEALPLYAFYHCHPYADQDVALLSTHPPLDVPPSEESSTDPHAVSRLGPRPNLVAEQCRTSAGRRLADAPGCLHLVRLLSEETDLVDLDTSSNEAVADYARSRLFDDIYHTHWFKFATASNELLPEWADRVATPAVGEEMAALSPDLLVVTGARAWEEIRDYVSPVTGSMGTVTDVHGHLFEFDPENPDVELSVLPMVDLASHWRNNRPSDSEERIRRSLRTFEGEGEGVDDDEDGDDIDLNLDID